MRENMTNMLSVKDAETGDERVDDGAGIQAVDVDSTRMEQHGEPASGAEQPEIGDLQAAADTFNTVFNLALSQLELSRREIETRSVRIEELDEAVRSVRSALDDEVGKGREREAEYLQETEQLKQRIQAAESERDSLQEKVRGQERTLDERSGEISELFARIEEFKATLEEQAAEGMRAREELEGEKSALNGKLDELQGLYDEAGSRLKAQRLELDESSSALGALRDRVESLLAEVESKDNEVARLDQQVTELQGEVDAQAESLRVQSESHATACEELNARISGVSGELESLRAAHNELQAHAEKIESLNQALHESSISENRIHKQQLDDKAVEIELLRSRLETADGSRKAESDGAAEAAGLKATLHDLEARFREAEARNQELSRRVEESGRLEELNGRLRVALQKAREQFTRNANESQDLQTLQEQVMDLQSALEAASTREQELADRLRDHAALEQEVVNLRESVSNIGGGQVAQGGVSETSVELKHEVEALKAALSASEEKCRQLHEAFSSSAGTDDPGVVLQVVTGRPQDVAAPGRDRFVAQLDTLIAGKDDSETHHSLMYVLLDNFISIRDEIGVMESESVIREVAKIIESVCGPEDVMARFGDCTFAVLCRHAAVDEVEGKAGGVRAAVEARIFECGGRSLVSTTSIGICSVRRNDVNAKDIISRADLACEAARLSGGNKVIVSSAIADEINITGNDHDHKEMVRSTIAGNRIKTYYQPISCLREQSVSKFEVLVRLVDESGDMILPGEFFAMAEGAGYADEVDRFVIENTMKVMSENRDQQTKFFVKLTRQSVADDNLPDWVVQKIGEYGIKPELLVFEISENVMQSDLKNVGRLSTALNEAGCKIAIEHYRMSTNMQHLMHVHTDYLKIDQGLVGSIEGKGSSLAKVTAIMELARDNNYITIAEGVETPGCLAILWELGVSMAQGYFIQAPAAIRANVDHDILSECSDDTGNKAKFEVS